MALLIILTALASSLSVLICAANQLRHSGFPAVSLWIFRTEGNREL